MEFQMDRNRIIQKLPLMIAGILLLVLAFLTVRIGRVSASELGILINNLTGNITARLEPGSFFYNGLISDLHTIDKTVHTLVMKERDGQEVRVKTRDGSDIKLDVEINFALDVTGESLIKQIIVESGVQKIPVYGLTRRGRRAPVIQYEEGYAAKWIRDYCRTVIRYTYGELSTEEFYDAAKRDAKTIETKRRLNELLLEHGIRVTNVAPETFSFYEEYEKKINEMKEADQKVKEQEEQAKTAMQLQQRKIVEAEKEVEVQIATIKGELEKKLISAKAGAIKIQKEAEAYSYTTKVKADAAFYEGERRAKGILAAAKAESEGLRNLVGALEGEGGLNLVMRKIAESLAKARIEGRPYTTDSLIKKVSIDGLGDKAERKVGK